MKILKSLHVSRSVFVICVLILLPVHSVAFATPLVNINTFWDWQFEIGAGGNITPISNWDEAHFEDIYPGESSSFTIPTLTAIADDEGEPALELVFTGSTKAGPDVPVIGGIKYKPMVPLDLTGGSASFSVKKRGPGDNPGKYSLHLINPSGNNHCVWVFDIPVRAGAADPWETKEFDFTLPTPLVTGGFDLTNVTQIQFDYRSRTGTAGSFTGKLDHITIVPEPATICLLGLGGLLVRRSKKA